MMPRDVIAAELGEHNATYPNGDLADDILARLREAGYAVVPRVATSAMIFEAMITAYPTVAEAGGVVEQAQEAARLEWAAMVAAAGSET